jgi:O-6-methylguanine DNA methyltransferase
MSKQQVVTKYQERVYAALQQIPEGRITSYAAMAKALSSSPRAVGGALRVNPFAPEIPCHRCIASTGVRCVGSDSSGEVLMKAVCWWVQGGLGECTQWAESDVKT